MRVAVAAIAVGALVASLGGPTAGASQGAEPGQITELGWSPNGKWLAFLDEHGAGDASSLSVVRLDRAVQRRVVALTSGGAALYGIAWSPDSRQLAVRGYDSAGRASTWISSANGRAVRQFAGRFDDWSPGSRNFVSYRSADGALYVVDSRSGAARFLVQGTSARWSPDGARIAFSRTTGSRMHIFSVDPTGGDLRQLGADSSGFRRQYLAGWSRDSTKVAYYEEKSFGELVQAFVVPADGSRQATKVAEIGYQVLWSPGGRRLAVRDLSTAGITIKTPDGATVATFPDAGDDVAWGPGGGNVVFTGSGRFGPGIYAARAAGSGLSRRVGPGRLPAWSKLGWIALASRGTCAGGGERVFVVRPSGKRLHALSRCRPTR